MYEFLTNFLFITPSDFVDVGSRDAVDQALHRLTKDDKVRRLASGLYDKPS